MLTKIIPVVLFITSKCVAQTSISSDVSTSTITSIEIGTTTEMISLIEDLITVKHEIKNKQVFNSTLGTNNAAIIASNITNPVPNQVISPVTDQVTNPVTNPATNPITNVVSNVYNRIPCSCFRGQCGCCTGSLLESFNQKACLNITYEPDEFAFNAALSLNGRVFYKNRISGKNPPPICIRIPRIRVVRLCARFSNVYFTGTNMHVCVGMEANWNDFTLFETLLNCFRVGSAGVAIVPPEDGGGISGAVDEEDYEDEEDYDDNARGFGNG